MIRAALLAALDPAGVGGNLSTLAFRSLFPWSSSRCSLESPRSFEVLVCLDKPPFTEKKPHHWSPKRARTLEFCKKFGVLRPVAHGLKYDKKTKFGRDTKSYSNNEIILTENDHTRQVRICFHSNATPLVTILSVRTTGTSAVGHY